MALESILLTIILLLAGLVMQPAPASAAKTNPPPAEAIFAGGCFWCMEKPFDEVDGVLETTVGYAGGTVPMPTYEQVSAGGTGHAESIRVGYDPKRVSYEKLLEVFWKNVDPFDAGGQFCDRGSQYRSAIFPVNAEQRRIAEASIAALEKARNRKIATRVEQTEHFWPAEDYHQNYYQRNPLRYAFYRANCGRDKRLNEVWVKGRQ